MGAWLARLAEAVGEAPAAAGPPPEQVLYLLQARTVGERTTVALLPRAARRLKAGGWGADRDYAAGNLAAATAKFVRPEDALIGRLLTSAQHWSDPGALPQAPDTVDLLLERALATGRCHWESKDGPVLRLGPERPGAIRWTLDARGAQLPQVLAEEPDLVPLPAASPWYVDPAAGVAGRLAFAWPRPALAALLQAPPVEAAQAPLVRERWPGSWAGCRRPRPTWSRRCATCRRGRR